MKLNVDPNKVAVFCQVVDSGNYQLASEALNVTPSALSQTVTGLERALGFALFDRVGRKLIPTERALRLHREFQLHQSAWLTSLGKIAGETAQVKGLVRVGAYVEFATSRLAPGVHRFIGANPDTQVKMVFDTPTRLRQLLQRGQLDLCFSMFPARDVKGVRSTSVFRQELGLIAPRSLLSDSPSFSEIMHTPMIEYFFNHQPTRRWLALHFQKRPKQLPVRVFAATSEMVVTLVRQGSGIGVVPLYLVEGYEKEVKIVRPTSRRLADFVWMLESAGQKPTAAHAAFREAVLSTLGD